MGINTNTCVLNTAFTAFNLDYRVVVLSDCVASMYGEDLHVLGLQNVARCLGWVLDNGEFRDKLELGASATIDRRAKKHGRRHTEARRSARHHHRRLDVGPLHRGLPAPDRLGRRCLRALAVELVGRGAGITSHPELLQALELSGQARATSASPSTGASPSTAGARHRRAPLRRS
jgi:hypothetical protein